MTLCSLCVLLLVASCGQESTTGPDPDAPKYNVLLISIDSVRQDRLGIYGHQPDYAPDVAVTPNIDQLAAEGVVFDQCWATSSWTLPSHMAVMTGLTDAAHGVVHDYLRLDPKRQTLASQFQAQGYQTAGFYSGPYLDPKYGFGKGFDYYASGMMSEDDVLLKAKELSAQKAARGEDPQITPGDMMSLRDHLSHEDISSPRINELGLDFLDSNSDKPFFLFLHYFDAHYDHIPEKMEPGLGKKFDPSYSGNFSPDNWYFNPAVRVNDPQTRRPKRMIGERDLGHIQAYYDAEIHWIDRHIGNIVSRLKELGVYENTVIAIVADHGDEFFEHGNIGHRATLFPEVLKVPFILRLPEAPAPGKRVPGVVRLYDVAPTLLDFAGLQTMTEAQGQSARLLVQEQKPKPRGVISHLSQLQQVTNLGRLQWRAQTQESWRDERYSIFRTLFTKPFDDGSAKLPEFQQAKGPGRPVYLFFDRQNDPWEQKGLPLSHPDFSAALGRYIADARQAQQSQKALPVSPPAARYMKALTETQIQALVKLGYGAAAQAGTTTAFKIPAFAPYPVPLKMGF